jgi:hypothetical protein
MSAHSVFREIVDMVIADRTGMTGFICSDNEIKYIAACRVLFSIHISGSRERIFVTSNLKNYQFSDDHEYIKNIVRDFVGKPHMPRVHKIYGSGGIYYYLSPEATTINGDIGYNIVWAGEMDMFGIYNYATTAEQLRRVHGRHSNDIPNILVDEIGDHPDFTITREGVHVIMSDGSLSNSFSIISVFNSGDMIVKNTFGPDEVNITIDPAINYIRRLKLAFSPPLNHCKSKRLGFRSRAYPHLLIEEGKIITRGEKYSGGPHYAYEDIQV